MFKEERWARIAGIVGTVVLIVAVGVFILGKVMN